MDAALDLAREAADVGEVPVGAVVLDGDGVVIGRGRNRREADGDPLAHAEVMALREAADSRKRHMNDGAGHDRSNDDDSCDDQTMNKVARQNAWNLADCTLVVTLEPCPMCAGAALQTHVGRIAFGAWDAKLGACGSVWDIPRDPHVGARPEVVGGVREAECAQVLADFFAHRRK